MRRSAVPVPCLIDLAKINELGLTILEASAPHACEGIAAISSPVPHAAGLPTVRASQGGCVGVAPDQRLRPGQRG